MSTAPDRLSRKRAWDVCCYTRRLHLLDVDFILLALLHAADIGAVDAAAADIGDGNGPALQSARLFAALQLKLRRSAIGPVSRERLQLLLPRLPACWQRILHGRPMQAA